MSFLPMIAVAGGLLALGPIIIHILFRFRYRVIDFAAMRFILEGLRRTKQRLRIEELIIIALRVLACVLIGWMLADLRAKSLLPGAAAPTAHVFLLDDSLSMGQQAGTETLFSKATRHLAESIEALGDGDLVAILSATRPDSGEPVGKLTLAAELKRSDALRRLTAMRPTDLRAKFPEALSAAEGLLQSQSEGLSRVYLVSDFRRPDFAEQKAADALRKAVAPFGELKGCEVICLDFGRECRSNLAIESVAMSGKLVIAGAPAPFEAVVRNHGTTEAETTLSVQIGEVNLPAIPLGKIGPNETATAEFRYTFPQPGSASLKLTVTADALPADNTAMLAVNVRDRMQILLVDDAEPAAAPGSAAYYLNWAFDPGGKGKFNQRVSVILPDGLSESVLRQHDLVILANVRQLRREVDEKGQVIFPQVELLERYVRDGGGLGVFLGDRTDPAALNEALYRGGSGLLPLKLREEPLSAADPEAPLRLRPDSIRDEPILRIFTGETSKFAEVVRFFAHVPAAPAVAERFAEGVGPPEIVATFDDEPTPSPALVRRTFGRGLVYVWHTVPDARWSNWRRLPLFLPVVNDMAQRLARAETEGYHGRVGEGIVYTAPPQLADATKVLLRLPSYPAEDPRPLAPSGEKGEKVYRYAATDQAGLYELEFQLPDGARRTVCFSRLPQREESNLAQAGEPEVLAALDQPNVRFHAGLAESSGKVDDRSPRNAYWWLFMAGVLVVLAAENHLGRVFGHHAPATEAATGRKA